MRLLKLEKSIRYHDVCIETLFPSFVWSCTVNIDPNDIKKEIYKLKGKYSSLIASNFSSDENSDGGYHSPYFSLDYRYQNQYPLLFDMVETCQDFVNDSLKTHLKVEKEVDYTTFWALINKPHDYNVLHVHPNTDLIGIYYISLPKKSGDLVVVRDDSFRLINLGVQTRRKFMAEEGQLYILPANLFHYVCPNMSSDDRISIAMNIKLKEIKNS
jgi:uncharacterized protein (TIGR02466 family)